ncbi:hypothetical protein [Chryseolinea lacunae]|uniref:Uncharacterized protein n=1 Tax=Chryseolinea lacunae TaxID=2801331 RepID=A0ABS1KZU6_9BACT|nr:hypothetical protein [Chryseolinea lacunae]MBL0744975.1 hypothetical protein [Chryseolinea lacunae]
MSDPKLTLEQAIKIRNDFSYLEGETVDSNGVETEINRIVVAPYYGKEFEAFNQAYTDSVDDELLATRLNPNAYLVFTFYEGINGVYAHESLFDTLKTLEIDIDLSQYGVRT